jgi:transcriptional antiterminator/mannitol/fructose-specific phosphotransferase system IIA component (Ntr-type)
VNCLFIERSFALLSFCPYKHGNELLEILGQASQAIPIDDLMDTLHLSRRSILYLIKKVDVSLSKNALLPIQNSKGIGYFLTAETSHQLLAYDEKRASYDLFVHPERLSVKANSLTPTARKILINYIVITQPGISIQRFMAIFSISRNTVIKELRAMDCFNARNGFQLITTSAGRKINGTETAQRQWVLENFPAILDILERNYNITGQPEIISALHDYEKNVGNQLTDDSRHIMKFFLEWYCHRLTGGISLPRYRSSPNEPPSSPKISAWAEAFLCQQHIHSLPEAHYLAAIMNLHSFSQVNQSDPLYHQLHDYASQLARQFEAISGLKISFDRKLLIDSLTVHLISVYHRSRNGIRYHNPLLEKLKADYSNLFYITKTALKTQVSLLPITFSDDEIGLLATYFGSAMLKIKEARRLQRILVICSSGIGTSQFLLLQLRERYPQLLFSGPFSLDDCQHISFQGIGLIITTAAASDLPRTDTPTLSVSPLPTRYEWAQIHSQLLENDFEVTNHPSENIHQLVDIIADFAKIEDMDGLVQGLDSYFYQCQTQPAGQPRSESADILLKYISFVPNQNNGLTDWHDAVRLAFQKLLTGHFIAARYIDKILQLIEQHNDCMLLGQGFLLAHAKPQDGVLHGSAAITLFQPGLALPDGRPIRCIICLAPEDTTSHLSFLAWLLQDLNDQQWCHDLLQINSQNELENFLWSSFS